MSIKNSLCTAATAACLISFSTAASATYIVTGFSPNNYLGGSPAALATMRANLGLSAMVIEDFVNLTLPTERLLISGSGVIDVVSENGNSWGRSGTGFLRLITSVLDSASIEILGGTSAFGMGFSALESGTLGALTSLSINGGAPIPLNSTTLPQFSFSFGIRNGYLLISAGPSDPLIQRIDLIQTGNRDGYQIDYLATSATVPEPTTLGLIALGLFTMPLLRRRWGL
jgi:hypothetical protein